MMVKDVTNSVSASIGMRSWTDSLQLRSDGTHKRGKSCMDVFRTTPSYMFHRERKEEGCGMRHPMHFPAAWCEVEDNACLLVSMTQQERMAWFKSVRSRRRFEGSMFVSNLEQEDLSSWRPARSRVIEAMANTHNNHAMLLECENLVPC